MERIFYFFLGLIGLAEALTAFRKSFLIDDKSFLVGTCSNGDLSFFSIGVPHDAN